MAATIIHLAKQVGIRTVWNLPAGGFILSESVRDVAFKNFDQISFSVSMGYELSIPAISDR